MIETRSSQDAVPLPAERERAPGADSGDVCNHRHMLILNDGTDSSEVTLGPQNFDLI